VAQLKQERQGKPYAAATPMTPDRVKIRELKKRIQRIELEKEILKKAYKLPGGQKELCFTQTKAAITRV